MSNSILTSTKKVLGIAEDDVSFDLDVVLHINSVFVTLNQLGVGPLQGFRIEDAVAVWEDFLVDDLRLNNVKSYMYLRVRLLFDPPTTSYTITAFSDQVKELEWRIREYREGREWEPPVEPDVRDDFVADGGRAC